MVSSDIPEPTERLIIPSGFRSSERLLEQIDAAAEGRMSAQLSRAEEEAEQEKERRVFKEFSTVTRPVILDPIDDYEEDFSANDMDEDVDLSIPPIEVQRLQAQETPQVSRLKSSVGRGFSSAGTKINLAASTSKRALTSDRTKTALRKTAAQTEKFGKATGRAAIKTGRVTRGTSFVVGKRLEERIFDKPKNQKPIFRSLESRERRLLGLPTNDILSRDELKSLALGITPMSVLRIQGKQIAQLDGEIEQVAALVNSGKQIGEESSQLQRLIISKESRGEDVTKERQRLTQLLATRSQLVVADKRLRELKEARETLLKSGANVPSTIRQLAFRRALSLQPELNPRGTLSFEEKEMSSQPRRRGRPRKTDSVDSVINV